MLWPPRPLSSTRPSPFSCSQGGLNQTPTTRSASDAPLNPSAGESTLLALPLLAYVTLQLQPSELVSPGPSQEGAASEDLEDRRGSLHSRISASHLASGFATCLRDAACRVPQDEPAARSS